MLKEKSNKQTWPDTRPTDAAILLGRGSTGTLAFQSSHNILITLNYKFRRFFHTWHDPKLYGRTVEPMNGRTDRLHKLNNHFLILYNIKPTLASRS